jgi:hypothetical protein
MINQKIRELRTHGLSFREISRNLNVSCSTVQRACKDVKMSSEGQKRHSQLNGLTKKRRIQTGLSKEKIRIISNLIFDSAVYTVEYHYSIMYVNSSLELINEFKKDINQVYKATPSVFEEIKGKNVTCYRVKYLSKQIYDDLLKYAKTYSTSDRRCSTPTAILDGEKEYKIIFLRAFWENEGSISKDGKLSADLKSLTVIKQLSKLHEEFGLKNYISRYWKNGWAYKLILNKNKENYAEFVKLGLFSKSKVTKGYFIGMKKKDVLKDYIKKRSWIN